MIRGERVILRRKRMEDAPTEYAWRIDEELSALDATTPVRMSYADYLRMYEDELRHPAPWSKRFAIETSEGKLIGSCMYYDIDTARGETEMGIMIGDRDYWSLGYGTDVVNILMDYVFANTSLKRVYLHTLVWNLRAQRSFQKCGFVPLREVRRSGYDFIRMELPRERWEALRNGLASTEQPESGGQGQ